MVFFNWLTFYKGVLMSKSISAYDLKKRVREYDVDMDMMHPNRYKMAEIALSFLPFKKDQKIKALDLGIGTGFFAYKFLQKFPDAYVIGLDGAAAMIDLAKTRFANVLSLQDFVVADFRDLAKVVTTKDDFDVIFSAFSLHHLTIEEKVKVLKIVRSLLKPTGWFINEDCIIAETPEVEAMYQKLRIEGILSRAKKNETRFTDFASIRAWLDKLEAEEQDNPIKISQELDVMSKAGLKHIEILWKEYREMVLCSQKWL